MLELLKTAQYAGLSAKYVLFDSWFSSPKTITALKQEHKLDTIAMVKKSSKIKYGYQGGRFNIKEIYSKNRKHRGRSKYLLSIEVTIGEEAMPAKIVCVRNKSKKHANCIGVWPKCRLIDILWAKVLIFQCTNPIFNVGSLSK